VTNQKSGISALGLQRALGLGSYETAWLCLHKLRRAMVRPGREQLSGTIEVDETFVGGREKGGHGGGRRAFGNKVAVAIAAEVRPKGIGRIRLAQIPDTTEKSLIGFVKRMIEPGSAIATDGWEAYSSLEEQGYLHWARPIQKRGKTGVNLLPRVHRVASLLKRWLLGMHQGKFSRKQLSYYLDEFTFRFNRRASQHRGKLFFRLMQQAVAVVPAPYKEIIRHR
jgi:transposase-like protein